MFKGICEKLIIVLILSCKVVLYLLDELFSGIDSMSCKKIINSIIKWMFVEVILLISDYYVIEIVLIFDEIVVVKD